MVSKSGERPLLITEEVKGGAAASHLGPGQKPVDRCCDACGANKGSLSSNADSQGEKKVANRRSVALRKDADHEFFQMTLISQVLTHKKQNQLIEIQADVDKLF